MAPKSGAAARLAELRALRASGKKNFDSYEVQEANDLYDEVDEDGYKKVVRGRLDQDDFVVGDNGEGYADDGREDWDNDRRSHYDSDSEEESAPRGKAGMLSTSLAINVNALTRRSQTKTRGRR